MKVARLFSIVHILLSKGKITAKELANKFEVSTRTIYRDIDILSMSGIPIYTDKGTGGGIRLLDSYVLNKSVISEEEKNSIILGLEVIKATNYDEIDTAINKLRNLFNIEKDNFIEVDFSGFDDEHQTYIFDIIKSSLKKNSTLEIVYKNSLGEKTNRMINPLKLVFKKQRWYLIAYCYKRQDYRTFRVSRINNIEVTCKTFNREDYNILNMVLTSHGINNTSLVTLTFDINALYRVEEEFKRNMIDYQDKKIIVVKFETEIDEWLTNYIMSYADYLIEIEPKELKNRIKEKAKKILDL